MPSVPIEMASETVIVPKVKGVPLAAKTPRLTSSTSGAMPELHGVTSLCVEATPTKGALMSLSVSPIAHIMERFGARMTPSVVSQLLCFPGTRPAAPAAGVSGAAAPLPMADSSGFRVVVICRSCVYVGFPQ